MCVTIHIIFHCSRHNAKSTAQFRWQSLSIRSPCGEVCHLLCVTTARQWTRSSRSQDIFSDNTSDKSLSHYPRRFSGILMPLTYTFRFIYLLRPTGKLYSHLLQCFRWILWVLTLQYSVNSIRSSRGPSRPKLYRRANQLPTQINELQKNRQHSWSYQKGTKSC